jgi:hypothetical protein
MSEADKFDAEEVSGGEAPAEQFDTEASHGGSSETVADGFDAETAVVGGWGWLKKVVGAVEQVGTAYLQTSQGNVPVTGDALKKAGEMVLGARGGDQSLQDKIKAIAALADRGDPAGKQAAGVLEMMNNLAKKYEAKAPVGAAAAVGETLMERDINAELDTGDAYDWGW